MNSKGKRPTGAVICSYGGDVEMVYLGYNDGKARAIRNALREQYKSIPGIRFNFVSLQMPDPPRWLALKAKLDALVPVPEAAASD